jgi:cytochrome c-type biogenesis protein
VHVTFPLAFAAGLVSFLSPCVLPLLPAYLSFMTGLTTAELGDEHRPVARVIVPALLFVAGFSVVFAAFGATASVVGAVLLHYRVVAERVAGLVLIAFGVLMLGIVRVPWLYGEARVDLASARRFGRGAAFVMGMAFAGGWTPCAGPILGLIGTVAGSSGSVGLGVALLLTYSAGLGVPFLLVAVFFGRLRPLLSWLGRHSLAVNRAAGVVLVLVGGLMFFGALGILTSFLARYLPQIEL